MTNPEQAMSKQLRFLNLICILASFGFLVMIVVTAVTSGDILTTDTLFIMVVCLVMAVMFGVGPLLYLHSEGKLPLPGKKKLAASSATSPNQIAAPAEASTAPLERTAPEADGTKHSVAGHATPHVDTHFAGTNKLFTMIWLALVALTLVEIVLAYLTMPIHIMLTVLLGLSIIKAALIVAYFMHLKFERVSLILTLVPMLVICICLLFVFFPDSFRSSNLRYKFQEAPPVAPAPVEEP